MLLQPLFHRQVRQGRARFTRLLGADPLKELGELGQRVIHADRAIKAAPVIDQVAAELLVLIRDFGQGQNLGRTDDCRIEAGLNTIIQEHGIENNPGGRREAKADITDA